MHWFPRLFAITICVLFSGTVLAAKDRDPSAGEGRARKESGKKRRGVSEKKGEKLQEERSSKMSIPMVEGHDSKGLKIPYYGEDGKLQMVFTIKVASKPDPDHMKMRETQIETFNARGEREMVIELPSSVLDLNTRVISTQERATIKRSDFEITGKTMEFNTETKRGRLGGKVRMLIYNLENEDQKPKPEPKSK